MADVIGPSCALVKSVKLESNGSLTVNTTGDLSRGVTLSFSYYSFSSQEKGILLSASGVSMVFQRNKIYRCVCVCVRLKTGCIQ